MKGLRVITTVSPGRPGDLGDWDRLDDDGRFGQLGLGIHFLESWGRRYSMMLRLVLLGLVGNN